MAYIRRLNALRRLRQAALTLGVASLFALGVACVQTSSVAEEISEKSAMITINNLGSGYLFEVYVNDEPVFCGEGLSLFSWASYPLRQGTNILRCIFISSSSHEARQDVNISDGQEAGLVEDVRIQLSAAKRVEKKYQFVLQSMVPSPSRLDSLQAMDHEIITREVSGLALQIVGYLRTRSFERLADLLGVSTDAIRKDYPEWFVRDGVKFACRSVEKESDLAVLKGSSFVLVHVSPEYLSQTASGHLLSVSHKEENVNFSKACLLFVRTKGQWCLVSGGEYLPLAESTDP